VTSYINPFASHVFKGTPVDKSDTISYASYSSVIQNEAIPNKKFALPAKRTGVYFGGGVDSSRSSAFTFKPSDGRVKELETKVTLLELSVSTKD
jgi:hypothetical protein